MVSARKDRVFTRYLASDLDVSQASAAFLERRIMKKLNKVAMLFAAAALAAPMSSAFAQATVDNWRNADA